MTVPNWWLKESSKLQQVQSGESLSIVGDLFIITDWDGIAKAIIQVSKIEKTPNNRVTAEFAKIEGEGDKSLAYWKKVHWDFFTRERRPHNQKPTEDMILICEHFKQCGLK